MTKKMGRFIGIYVTAIVIVLFGILLYLSGNNERLIDSTQDSYSDTSITATNTDFHTYLSRDLHDYFKREYNKDLTVTFELLRDGPTQSGMSSPKYYCRVIVKDISGNMISQGAVKVAVIDGTKFDVTNFISIGDVIGTGEGKPMYNEGDLSMIFPGPIVEKIMQKAGTESTK